MSTGKKQGEEPAVDLFDRIEQAVADDDVERILAMDDAQLDRELAAGGFDPAAVRAKGRAIGEAAMGAARRARLVKGAKIGVVVAAVVAIGVGAAWLLRAPAPIPITPEPIPSTAPKPGPTPRELRLEAMAACDEKQWNACVTLLDRAAALDPAGDRTPEVVDARARAARGRDVQESPPKPK